MIDKLIEQSPYLAAIVLIVWAFLQAQGKRDTAFLDAQAARDKLFLDAIHQNNTVTTGVQTEVQKLTENIIEHNVESRATAAAILRAAKDATPKPRKVNRG